MSETTSARDPGQPGASQPPLTEEQAREYLAALRTMPAHELVAELLFGLLNAAQAKLGRRDARLLIDLAAGMLDQARPYFAPDLVKQVDQVLTQLRLGQVKAEGSTDGTEPNDLSQVPTPPTTRAAAPAARPAAPIAPTAPTAPTGGPVTPSGPASRLWVPGRDF